MSYDVMDCQLLSATLLVMLVICAWTDWKQDRVPNAVTIPGILAGLAGWCWWQGVDGFVYSACSAAVMLIVLLLAYATGGMGGGDVKLMTAMAALSGFWWALSCILLSAFIAAVCVVIRGCFTGKKKRIRFAVWLLFGTLLVIAAMAMR